MRSLLISSLLGVALLSSGFSYAACPDYKVDSIYQNNGNGTVTDNETGLMWEIATTPAQTWDQALATGEAATTAGYVNWRLPNAKELASLVDRGCPSPTINPTFFPAAPAGIYWTSSPSNQFADSAFTVDFTDGSLSATAKNLPASVRLVRAGY